MKTSCSYSVPASGGSGIAPSNDVTAIGAGGPTACGADPLRFTVVYAAYSHTPSLFSPGLSTLMRFRVPIGGGAGEAATCEPETIFSDVDQRLSFSGLAVDTSATGSNTVFVANQHVGGASPLALVFKDGGGGRPCVSDKGQAAHYRIMRPDRYDARWTRLKPVAVTFDAATQQLFIVAFGAEATESTAVVAASGTGALDGSAGTWAATLARPLAPTGCVAAGAAMWQAEIFVICAAPRLGAPVALRAGTRQGGWVEALSAFAVRRAGGALSQPAAIAADPAGGGLFIADGSTNAVSRISRSIGAPDSAGYASVYAMPDPSKTKFAAGSGIVYPRGLLVLSASASVLLSTGNSKATLDSKRRFVTLSSTDGPLPPSSVRGRGTGDSDITLEWLPPADDCGFGVTSYTVKMDDGDPVPASSPHVFSVAGAGLSRSFQVCAYSAASDTTTPPGPSCTTSGPFVSGGPHSTAIALGATLGVVGVLAALAIGVHVHGRKRHNAMVQLSGGGLEMGAAEGGGAGGAADSAGDDMVSTGYHPLPGTASIGAGQQAPPSMLGTSYSEVGQQQQQQQPVTLGTSYAALEFIGGAEQYGTAEEEPAFDEITGAPLNNAARMLRQAKQQGASAPERVLHAEKTGAEPKTKRFGFGRKKKK
jgi:hypothetical protein